MKKSLFFLSLFLTVFCLSATKKTENYRTKLIGVYTTDDVDRVDYYYLENLKLDAFLTQNPEYQLWDSLVYNELGQVVRVNSYQWLNNEWLYVSYVDFTYDANGNKTSRKNYNNFGGFELGGTYIYSYNADNQLIHWEMFFGEDDLAQVCEVTYNAAGYIQQELCQETFWGSPLENSWKIDYQYDANNNLTHKIQSSWTGSSWSSYSEDRYTYDSDGNCLVREQVLYGDVVDRHEYMYDTQCPIEQVVMPISPEPVSPTFPPMKNRVVLDQWSTMDMNTNQLVYVCDYVFRYEQITSPEPNISVTPDVLTFELNLAKEGDNYLTISNSGDADGEFTASIIGEDETYFAFSNDNQGVIAPNTAYDLYVTPTDNISDEGTFEAIILIETNDLLHPVFEIPVILNVINGVAELQCSSKVFPNPASLFVQVQADALQSVTMYDITGRIVYQASPQASTHQIDVSTFQQGIYLLQLQHPDGSVETQRVVVSGR